MSNKIIYPSFKGTKVQLNRYISLRLEEGKTNIYVNNTLFRQCKSLIFNIPITDLDKYNDINSIDDLEQELPISKYKQLRISPENEFWGHCSNIQAWIENDYDTKILHHTLAFPLLRELYRLNDIKAKRLFKDEVISRFISGSSEVKLFLLEEGFLNDFTLEEKDVINKGLEEIFTTSYFAKKYLSEEKLVTLFDKNELDDIQSKIRPKSFSKSFSRKFDELNPIHDINDIEELKMFTDITDLTLIQNKITEIKGLEKLTYLRELALNYNEITEIKNLDHLQYLRYLSLPKNNISKIKGLDNLTELEFLSLGGNQISKIEGLENLRKLKILSLGDNRIKDIEGLETLTDLRELRLGGNHISELQGLDNLKNLRVLVLVSNKISKIKGLENLARLREVAFYGNNISKIQNFPNLPDLQEVSLRMNPINEKDTESIRKVFGTRTEVFF